MHKITTSKIPQLPSIVNSELAKFSAARPSWATLGDLPSTANTIIRKIGEELFAYFTNTHLNLIQVLSTFNPECTDRDVKLVSAYLRSKGKRKEDATIIFEKYFPDYKAEVVIYEALGFEFMLVMDQAGSYIYAYEPKLAISGTKLLEHHNG